MDDIKKQLFTEQRQLFDRLIEKYRGRHCLQGSSDSESTFQKLEFRSTVCDNVITTIKKER